MLEDLTDQTFYVYKPSDPLHGQAVKVVESGDRGVVGVEPTEYDADGVVLSIDRGHLRPA
jgi:hypothetical protein